MAAKKKPPGISGSIHPAVIEAAGLDCDRPEERAWIAERYNASFHPLPVHFAEVFDLWNRAPEEERERQIKLEESDAIAAGFTLLGAKMGGGILPFRERFARACATAATVGDREFFRSFDEVFFGLAGDKFPVSFAAAVVRAWHFLTRSCGKRTMKWSAEDKAWADHCAMAGEFPTVAEIRDYLEATGARKTVKIWPADNDGPYRRALRRHGLEFIDKGRGGDRRSKEWQSK